jgi:hypothetical protein
MLGAGSSVLFSDGMPQKWQITFHFGSKDGSIKAI